MRVWKVLGVAGLAGVAATGAIIARNQRARTQLTPDEVRERLRLRVTDAQHSGQEPDPDSTESSARA